MVDGTEIIKEDAIKHCQVNEIKICTKYGSTNITIQGELITCNDCNSILCYEHQNSENTHE